MFKSLSTFMLSLVDAFKNYALLTIAFIMAEALLSVICYPSGQCWIDHPQWQWYDVLFNFFLFAFLRLLPCVAYITLVYKHVIKKHPLVGKIYLLYLFAVALPSAIPFIVDLFITIAIFPFLIVHTVPSLLEMNSLQLVLLCVSYYVLVGLAIHRCKKAVYKKDTLVCCQ